MPRGTAARWLARKVVSRETFYAAYGTGPPAAVVLARSAADVGRRPPGRKPAGLPAISRRSRSAPPEFEARWVQHPGRGASAGAKLGASSLAPLAGCGS